MTSPPTHLRLTLVLLHRQLLKTRTLLRWKTRRMSNQSHQRSCIYHQKRFKRLGCRRRNRSWTRLQRKSEEKRNDLPFHLRTRPSMFPPHRQPSGLTLKRHHMRNTIRLILVLTPRLTESATMYHCQTTMSLTPPRSK